MQSPAGFGGQFGYYTDLETGNATAPGMGLLCLTHRDYDPSTGRFLTHAPSGYGGVNLYGFAGDNPVNKADPSGLDWVNDLANLSVGMGDTVSGGLTRRFRQLIGYNEMVDKTSTVFHTGKVAGYGYLAVDAVIGGVGAVNGIKAIGAAGGMGAAIGASEVARAAMLGLRYRVRASGAVHVLEDDNTLSVIKNHFEGI